MSKRFPEPTPVPSEPEVQVPYDDLSDPGPYPTDLSVLYAPIILSADQRQRSQERAGGFLLRGELARQAGVKGGKARRRKHVDLPPESNAQDYQHEGEQ